MSEIRSICTQYNCFVWRRARDLRRLIDNGEALIERRFGGYVYRPGEILLGAADEPDLADHLRRRGGRSDEEANRRFEERGLQLRRWLLDKNRSVPDVVQELRQVGGKLRVIGPNHLLGSEPAWNWGGGGAPRPASPLPEGTATPSSETAAIAVLDTGVASDTATLHPNLFAALTDTTGDIDVLDDDGDGKLDSGAGHGTFVLGVLHRLAPDLLLDVEPVLGAHGFGDDASVALGVSETTARIRNLSFGGYTHDNMEPPGLRAALDAAGPDVLFVAAAGNHAQTEPFWPAAFPEVIAVAALDTTGRGVTPAAFTNRGEWVDVCAPGVNLHSTYVNGVWPGALSVLDREFTGWARWSGTSFAAPQIAAVIAQLAAEHGTTPQVAANDLLTSLTRLPGHPDVGPVYLPPTDLVHP